MLDLLLDCSEVFLDLLLILSFELLIFEVLSLNLLSELNLLLLLFFIIQQVSFQSVVFNLFFDKFTILAFDLHLLLESLLFLL